MKSHTCSSSISPANRAKNSGEILSPLSSIFIPCDHNASHLPSHPISSALNLPKYLSSLERLLRLSSYIGCLDAPHILRVFPLILLLPPVSGFPGLLPHAYVSYRGSWSIAVPVPPMTLYSPLVFLLFLSPQFPKDLHGSCSYPEARGWVSMSLFARKSLRFFSLILTSWHVHEYEILLGYRVQIIPIACILGEWSLSITWRLKITAPLALFRLWGLALLELVRNVLDLNPMERWDEDNK